MKPQDRLDQWQRKLLDLSLRNALLNFRAVKRSIACEVTDLDAFATLLASTAPLHLTPRTDTAPGKKVPADTALRRDINVDMDRAELDSRLVGLYRTSRTALEEGGANTLFLALGFLEWTRDGGDGSEASSTYYRAPLLLVPMTLARKSARAGFTLARHEDEPRFNPALIEMLRRDFQIDLLVGEGFDPNGAPDGTQTVAQSLNISAILCDVGEAVHYRKPTWRVTGDVVLASFSFSKYLMWTDLVARTEQLKQNPVVRHLLETPRAPYHGGGDFVMPAQLDTDFEPDQVFCPLPADSSQLAAVMSAAKQKDFVLVGPPGTGKSQTIANLIAHCLADNKTVLFVSEKMAALDVVHRRLVQAGLGDFCLPLHSNKARKTEVLDQLRRSWEAQGDANTREWYGQSTRLRAVRDDLNRFVTHLHQHYPNGLTPYIAMGTLVSRSTAMDPATPTTAHEDAVVALSWAAPDLHTVEDRLRLRALAERLEVNRPSRDDGVRPHADAQGVDGADVTDKRDRPSLTWIKTGDWSPNWQDSLIAAARALPIAVAALAEADAAFAGAAGYVQRGDPVAGRAVTEAVAGALIGQQERDAIVQGLSVPYTEAVDRLDIDRLLADWKAASAASFVTRWLGERRVRNALGAAVDNTAAGKSIDVAGDLPRLAARRALDRQLADYARQQQREGTRQDAPLNGAQDGPSPSTPTNAAALDAAKAYRQARQSFDVALEALARLAGVPITADALRDAPTIAASCQGLLESVPTLRAWCAWRRACEDAEAAGLAPLVAAIERDVPDAVGTFERAYARWWLGAVVDQDEVLRQFVSAEHEKRIDEFRTLEDSLSALARVYMRAKLCGNVYGQDDVRKGTEWGTLKREIQKKRAHMPLRLLIEALPTALARLAPCLLMSPLSVAQYLSTKSTPFDLVVFDEASQIPVWDAIGAMARARQVIMVGDPKQLPPTSFFARAEAADDDTFNTDDEAPVEADLESILDECLGANLPTLDLTWHYRSRHESLIAFSNHRYYDGKLVTFASPVTDDRAVSLSLVPDGVYEKGGARINRPEAEALVAHVVARLREPVLVDGTAPPTIGIVTFNAEQQHLIQDLLDDARRHHPSIEPHFAETAVEPVFVKNLESVQGDERDVIYFSITYGPDASGAMSMNFGPINQAGGERRLNVAITRARRQLIVFSSVPPDRIDLSRTSALGVRDLRHFLDYADRGARAFVDAQATNAAVQQKQALLEVGDGDASLFEQAVATALREKGWEVHLRVGVSSFRIDLAVVDPRAPGRYLAGIECDGVTYQRAATARDRDKSREQVLRGLGWEILRIWATDWWHDPQGALKKTHDRLVTLRDTSISATESE